MTSDRVGGAWGWMGDRELYWTDAQNKFWASTISLHEGEPEVGAARPLFGGVPFDDKTSVLTHDKTRDRFLIGTLSGDASAARLVIVSDWRP